MRIICDNCKENIDTLNSLLFILRGFELGTQPYLEVSIISKMYLNWEGNRTALEKQIYEYLPKLPSNFLVKIKILESLGLKPVEILDTLRETSHVVSN